MFWEKSEYYIDSVALYTRAWVEIKMGTDYRCRHCVALYARAGVEI